MKLFELVKILDAKVVNMPDENVEVEDGYCGDFLSFVMQKAPENSAWFTVMTNINVCAVASLTGVAVVVVCEGSKCDEQLIARIKQQDVALIETKLDIFNAVKIYLGK